MDTRTPRTATPQLLCVISILVLTCSSFAQTRTAGPEQAIASVEDQMTTATLKGDLAASESFLAPGYVRVYSNGSVLPNDDLRNGVKCSSIDISERQIHVTGDTAVSVFKASVKATVHGQPIEGHFRSVRTWALDHGQWKAMAYATLKLEEPVAAALPPSSPPPQHARVEENAFISDDLPKLQLTLAPTFKYLGSFSFDIRAIAGGYRYLWGEVDRGNHLRRVFIVQAEDFYPTNNGTYDYGAPNPVVVAGDTYQHNVWIYDNDASAQEQPDNESDLTRKFLHDHGYTWEPQLIMSRFARVVDESKKNEIIFFYFENLKDYTPKAVKDFPEEPTTTEHKSILAAVDANSRKAFTLSR